MTNNKKPPYTQEEEVEEIRKQQYLKLLERWKNRTEKFTILEQIPVPVVEKEDYKNIIVPAFIRCGAIPKSQLEIGERYIGSCRNASIATWLGDKFEYERYKFGDTFKEKINHFEDDNGYDLFVPIGKILKPEEEEAVDLNDPCVFCSVCHYLYKDGNKSNCPTFNKRIKNI